LSDEGSKWKSSATMASRWGRRRAMSRMENGDMLKGIQATSRSYWRRRSLVKGTDSLVYASGGNKGAAERTL